MKFNQKNLLISGAAVLAIAGALYLQFQPKTESPAPASTSPTPSQTTPPNPPVGEDSVKKEEADPTKDWKTYQSQEFGFSFKHPNLIECCSIAGPQTGENQLVVVLADAKAASTASGKPFDGFAIYVVKEKAGANFNNYIETEKRALREIYRAFVGEDPGDRGQESTYQVGGRSGIRLTDYGWDNVERIYVPFPDNQKILVIAKIKDTSVNFSNTFNQIMATFSFI